MKFDQKYNHDIFSAFLRDFLPEDYVEKEKDIADLSRAKIITSARELGHSSSLDVYVLEMTHAKETDSRVSIATDAFKILAIFGYDKALVIFKNDESENYRFSYLTISLDLNEKGKVAQKYSNARRYSFYLGTGAKTKTPEQQLVRRGRVKDTEDLLSRFSLEVVNKQFYLEIAKFFDELVDEQNANLVLPSQSDTTVRKNFAMRLIGRLMFCWFLKQKKSKDGALVPDELLSARAVKDGYYHAVLELLFFEILNTQIDERDIRNDVYDKVPYLNGGLFSPQHNDYYELDRATFTSRHINTLRVADVWFKAFFELLETYNFTIDENTVFDQELSVDPEMLGRIFENLLAEINPDTGGSERKRTGSYYTPRQVVEYMVDQSIIEYLKTATSIEEKRLAALVSYDLGDDGGNQLTAEENEKVVGAVEKLKILDPACGSGAFPIGALQKVVWVLQRVDPNCRLWLNSKLKEVPELYRKKITDYFHSNPPDYIRKLDIIKNSIFGVDIQSIAVEMSRLRCFLTLVVESEIDDAKKNRGIEPLPNLDFKFVCANTLVGLPKKGSNGLFEDHSGIEALSAIMSEYFSSSNQRKAEIRQRFTNAQKDILNKSLSSFGKSTGELTLKLSLWDPFSNATSPWFDPEWMFGLDHKFDVVIGNPPYVKEDVNKGAFDGLRESECYQGKMDLWYLFGARGMDLLAQDGVLAFIAINNWTTNDGASKFRKKIITQSQIVSYVDFGDFKVFSAGVQTMILITRKSIEKNTYTLQYKKFLDPDISYDALSELLSTNESINDVLEVYGFELDRSEYIDSYLTFIPSHIRNILDKIQQSVQFRLRADEIYSGIDVMQDFVARKHLEKLSTSAKTGDGIFVLSNDEIRALNLSDKERALLKPYYTAREIRRFAANKESQYWIIYAGNSLNDKIGDYPNIKTHLDKFREVITSVNKPYGLHRTREEKIFLGEKILSLRKCSRPTFSYVDFPAYVSRAFLVIKTERVDLKYLTAVLNSKIVAFWLKHKGKMQGSNYQVDILPLTTIPLPYRARHEAKIIALAEKLLGSKSNPNGLEIEKQIDALVAEDYGLTKEEMSFVEMNI